MRSALLIGLIGVSTLVPVAAVQRADLSSATTSLTSATALRCTFSLYIASRWVSGEPEAVAGDDTFQFTIEALDPAARRARVVGASGSADVSAFLTGTGWNVIEQTPIGNFILTTVFASGRTGELYPAVHSRHLGDVGAPPSPSQYFGSCEAVR